MRRRNATDLGPSPQKDWELMHRPASLQPFASTQQLFVDGMLQRARLAAHDVSCSPVMLL